MIRAGVAALSGEAERPGHVQTEAKKSLRQLISTSICKEVTVRTQFFSSQ